MNESTPTRKIRFRFPDAGTPGVLGFFNELPAKIAALQDLQAATTNGKAPTPQQVSEIVDLMLFFALDEPDKDEAKRVILREMSMNDIATALTAILREMSPAVNPVVSASAE